MKLKRYFFFGVLVGLVAPALLIVFSITAHHVFESWVVALVIPGFLPFGSTDPGQEMSWLSTMAAFALNAGVFGFLGLLLGVLLNRNAQPSAPADGLRPPLS
jgi:hypothetical protein